MQPRRSNRTVKSSTDSPVAKDDDYVSDGGEHSEEDVPKQKKRGAGGKRKASTKSDSTGKAPAAKRRRGNRGLLKDVVDMPMDIVYEIFGHLSPGDLLNLSHTSKDLRNILLSKSSLTVWKEARENVPGLPDCPTDLSEPQYANLCFGKYCMKCLRTKPSTLYHMWSARVRYCKSCLIDESTGKLAYYQPLSNYSSMAPHIRAALSGGRKFRVYYHEPSIRKWDTKLSSAGSEKAAVVAELTAIHKHGEALKDWYTTAQEALEEQKANDMGQRAELVVDHAKKLGWTDEFGLSPDAADTLKECDEVRKACAKNLTDKALRNLETTINEVLEDVRVQRLAAAVKALLKQRLPILKQVHEQCLKTLKISPVQLLPSVRQLYELPSVRNLVLKTPESEEMTVDHFQPVADNFAGLVDEWRALMDQNLLGLIKDGYGPDHVVNEGTLGLATTFFVCSGSPVIPGCPSLGKEPISYPRVVCHACSLAKSCGGFLKVMPPLEKAEDDTLREILGEGRWNHWDRLTFRPDCSAVLGDIIELCGFDRQSTTRAEMDIANPILECLSCHKGSKGRAVMTWWQTIHHWRDVHSSGYFISHESHNMKLRIIEDFEEADQLRRELAIQKEKDAACHSTSVCAECHEKDTTANLKVHWKKKHGRTAVVGDILPQLDKSHFHEIYYAWPPRDEDEHALIVSTEIVPLKHAKPEGQNNSS